MYKKILILICLLAFLVSAQDLGDPCLNNEDCNSGICQGGECREVDILTLLQPRCSIDSSLCYGSTPVCDASTDRCVGCLVEADCTYDDDLPVCDTAQEECVECLVNNDCTDDDYPYCNVQKECTECLEDSDCSSGYECDHYECEEEDDEFDEEDEKCFEDWECSTWSACLGGRKTRTCEDESDCGTENYRPEESFICTAQPSASCNDGMKNQAEEGVDCGGPCNSCNSCYDNSQNCHGGLCEEGLDCGGPCIPCKNAISIMLIIITAVIVIILIILGIWYWSLKKTGETAGKAIKEFRPPMQPSSRLKI